MYQKWNDYLGYQGFKYIKPEKAGPLVEEMLALKALGQAARSDFTELAKLLNNKVVPFEMTRVSNWVNQAQIARPHFWCYFKHPKDSQDDVGIAIRLYGQKDDFGISVEVSFVERKKSDRTLAKQHQVLSLPLEGSLYYFVQKDGFSRRMAGTESNRQILKRAVNIGSIRKVLVKYDLPLTPQTQLEDLTDSLAVGFEKVMPYYEATKKREEQ
ncbi:HI_0552 family protein [Streptococcus dentapri]|uniref:HI_0552 family protein n=1 Tax=Streptococcus dentapri TaxID=573564 RepID=A0ABV8D1U0_9STRE